MLNATKANEGSVGPTCSVSLIICGYTLDRWSDICKSIESALAQGPAIDEVIVVSDYNDELFSRLTSRYANVKVIKNVGARGLSGARNTGVAAANGTVLAFLDDDAIALPGCFDNMRRAVVAPNVLGVSGRIAPAWETAHPAWFPPEFFWVVGCTDPNGRTGTVRNLIGAAMAIRREVFVAVGGFNSRLGRTRAALPMGGEETELCIRAALAIPNGEFRCENVTLAMHKVHAGRSTVAYFVRRCYAEGLSKAMLSSIAGSVGSLSAEREACLKTLPLSVCRGLRDGVVKREASGFLRAGATCLGLTCTVAGFVVGKLRSLAGRSMLRADPRKSDQLGDQT